MKRVLIIGNPAAQNGNGSAAAHRAREGLARRLPAASFELVLTERPGQAAELACAAAGRRDTVIAVGGDGLVHEVVNGLMRVDSAARPAFGLVPSGTGNDYARTLGVSFEVERALDRLAGARERMLDVGCCNGEHFVETLSFGLDAAIALDTVERRRRTGQTGTRVFLASGIDMLLHHVEEYRYTARFDGESHAEGGMLLFAVQVGPTYGGGFRICPDADPADGLLDICVAHPPLSVPKSTLIFLLAKNAHHTRFKNLEFRTARRLSVVFDRQPPAQIDGEPFPASRYDISVVPRALRVLAVG